MAPMVDRAREESGFTLIEVMISLVVLLVALLGVAAAFPAGLVASRLGEDVTKATHLAQERIDQLRTLGYGTLASRAAAMATESPYWAHEHFDGRLNPSGEDGLYTRDVGIQCWAWNGAAYVQSASPYASPCPSGSVLRVLVRVNWSFRGVARTVQLQTFVGARE